MHSTSMPCSTQTIKKLQQIVITCSKFQDGTRICWRKMLMGCSYKHATEGARITRGPGPPGVYVASAKLLKICFKWRLGQASKWYTRREDDGRVHPHPTGRIILLWIMTQKSTWLHISLMVDNTGWEKRTIGLATAVESPARVDVDGPQTALADWPPSATPPPPPPVTGWYSGGGLYPANLYSTHW